MNHLEVGCKRQQIRGQYGYGYKKTGWVCLQTITDYSPFGVTLDGRTIQSDFYRYGYQGSEKDDEVKGEGNSYTTEFRQYDPRIGRWLSLDPLMSKFPWQSPYTAYDNNPIYYTDPQGAAAGGPGDPEKIPAGSSTTTSGSTTEDLLSRTTTISTTNTERTFNVKNETFTTTTTVTNTIINTDKLTNKTTFSTSSYSSTETKTYEETTGKKFNPYSVQLEGLLASDEYKKMDAVNQWNNRQLLESQAYQYDNPNAGANYREQLDKSVFGLLPWYNIARGIEDIQGGNNWGWLKIGLEIVPLEELGVAAKAFAPALVYESKLLGYNSRLFGIGRNGFEKGVLNKGVVRMGWGFEASSKSHVFRVGIGNNPKFYTPTSLTIGMKNFSIHQHINLLKVPAKF
jgi:RHS repeat-associated protein